jgi:outer membrane lipoprotein-sorting protein
MSLTRPLCAALLCLAASGTAFADARSDLHAAFGKTLAAKSYRATMTDLSTGKQVSTVEFQAPDRYRISVPGRPASVIAGGFMYLEANGQAMKVPLPAGMMDQYRGDAAFRQLEATTVFTSLGMDKVGAEPARKYHWVSSGKTGGDGNAWVSVRTGQVLQVESHGKVRVAYSDFNSPAIQIVPPK